MTEPYKAPQSEIKKSAKEEISSNAVLISIVYVVIIGLFSFFTIEQVPNFSYIFNFLWDDLGSLTRLMFKYYILYTVFFFISLILAIALMLQSKFSDLARKRIFVAVKINFIVALIFAILVITFLYMPIIENLPDLEWGE